jgi:hypothetical protein
LQHSTALLNPFAPYSSLYFTIHQSDSLSLPHPTSFTLLLSLSLRTGFSKAARGARKITTENDVAEDFYHFMQSFLTVRGG